jgi:Bacterial PH domain
MSNYFVGFVVALLMPAFNRWLMRSSSYEAPQFIADSTFVMKSSSANRRVLLAGVWLGPVIAAGVMYYTFPYWKLGIAFSAFFLAMFCLPAVTLLRRVTVSSNGIEVRSPWIGTRRLGWNDVDSLTYRRWGRSIVITSKCGQRFVVPGTLAGMSAFEASLAHHLRPSDYEMAFSEYRDHLASL